ncbi:MAG: hypothetical protein ACFBZ8_06845 [Opitutales bacterium]
MSEGPAAIAAATRPARFGRLIRRLLLWSAATLGVLALSVALAMGWLKIYTDGGQIHQRANEAVLRYVLWEEPEAIDARVNRVRGNREACLSPDGQTLVFTRQFSPGNTDLFVQRRIGEDWSAPERMRVMNTIFNEGDPAFSPDGQQLFFTSDRPEGAGGFDLWVAEKTEKGWDTPQNLGFTINTPYDEVSPSPDTAQRGLYFSTNRSTGPGEQNASLNIFFAYFGNPETDASEKNQNDPILYRAPFEMKALNSAADEAKVVSASRGDVLYLVSERPGGLGGSDLYRSLRVDGVFQPPTNLGQPVNSAMDESAPSVHPDGFRLYFNSNRLSRTGDDFNLFQAASREVLVRIDYDLLRYLLVCLLLAAIALLAINHLLQLFFNSQSSLKLIPRCLLASLLVHVILLALSGTWYLRSKIEEKLTRPQEMTINVNALARESIGLAIRESVGALPAVESSASAALPAPSWEAPSSAPSSTPTPVAAGLPEAGQSDASPLQTEVFQQVRAANPSVASTSPKSFHEPFEMGPTAVTMEEMPRGASSAGSPNATANAAGSPSSELADGSGANSQQALIEGPRGSSPQSYSSSQVGSTEAVQAATAADASGASDATSSWKSHLNANQKDGRRNSETADALADATGAQSRSSAESSLGSFLLPVALVMEVPDALDGLNNAELGLLRKDPYQIEPTALEALGIQSRRFSALLRGGTLVEIREAVLSAFGLVEHAKGGYEPGRVGDVVTEAIPALRLPADSELEVPEAYLDLKP